MTNIFLFDNVDSFTYNALTNQFRTSKEQSHD